MTTTTPISCHDIHPCARRSDFAPPQGVVTSCRIAEIGQRDNDVEDNESPTQYLHCDCASQVRANIIGQRVGFVRGRFELFRCASASLPLSRRGDSLRGSPAPRFQSDPGRGGFNFKLNHYPITGVCTQDRVVSVMTIYRQLEFS